MNSLIEPNIHPVFVHFAIALLITAVLTLAVAAFAPAQARWRGSLQAAGDWMLLFGLIALAGTVAAGFQAYYSVAHDTPSHATMTTHRNWALAAAALFLIAGIWRWTERRRPPSAPAALTLLVAAGLIAVTGWWGGRLVFHHGLGVASLPQVSGESHAHDHGPGDHDHDHAAPAEPAPVAADSPQATADAFHDALAAGDEAAVRRLLAPEVLILESGGSEKSLEEYAAHHMRADMEFMRAVKAELLSRASGITGDTAWVATERAVRGKVGARDVAVKSQETLVLRREAAGWRIVHVHWSNSPLPTQAEKKEKENGAQDHGDDHDHGDHEHDGHDHDH